MQKATGQQIWGPPLWLFIHTICERIDEDYHRENNKMVIEKICELLRNVPCPICSKHVNSYLKRYNLHNIKTKQQLITFFFHFHNSVNKRNGKKIFTKEELKIYKTLNIAKIYPYVKFSYTKQYYNKTNFNGWRRKQILKNFIKWINTVPFH